MTKVQVLSGLFILIISCNDRPIAYDGGDKREKANEIRIYSKNVADSFSIFVNLPSEYDSQGKKEYPVVFLLDANLYFDIIATTINKYSEVGLAPTVILIGIGYKDFPMMDSLRNRDDTYPEAIPEYEMAVSGGADKFLSFITRELIPYVDKKYKTDTSKRVLMGHSLAGYFTTYALLQNLGGIGNGLTGYIAASPSLHYNHYYLLEQLKGLPDQKPRKGKLKVYITYGGLEEDGNVNDPGILKLSDQSKALTKLLSEKQSACLTYKSDLYSNLGHMDTQIPTFIKGLQWMLGEDSPH